MSFQNHSCNDNQNYFVQQGRTTSRVLNPPGGKTSFTLGTWEPPVKKEEKAPKEETPAPVEATKETLKEDVASKNETTPAVVVVAPTEEKKTPAEADKKPTVALPAQSTLPGQQAQPVSANAFASGANINGPQVMTGRPTSRVLCPGGGGGKVSWTLG